MEARTEEQPNDSGEANTRDQPSETNANLKLRDLQPEKDPIGAGNQVARGAK